MENKIIYQFEDEPVEVTYEVLRSRRKTIGLEVKPGGNVIVRAPAGMSSQRIKSFVEQKADWIYKAYNKQKDVPDISELKKEEKSDPRLAYLEKKYRAAAKKYIYERVEYYLPMTGGAYDRIRIGDQKTRWGSCSANGTLSFSWRLMLAPPRVLDYVVIHELCHLTYMDHSKRFWDKVEGLDPDYREHRQWLKDNGSSLVLK